MNGKLCIFVPFEFGQWMENVNIHWAHMDPSTIYSQRHIICFDICIVIWFTAVDEARYHLSFAFAFIKYMPHTRCDIVGRPLFSIWSDVGVFSLQCLFASFSQILSGEHFRLFVPFTCSQWCHLWPNTNEHIIALHNKRNCFRHGKHMIVFFRPGLNLYIGSDNILRKECNFQGAILFEKFHQPKICSMWIKHQHHQSPTTYQFQLVFPLPIRFAHFITIKIPYVQWPNCWTLNVTTM